MKRVITICFVSAVIIAMPASVQAERPFVNLSPSSNSLTFGDTEFSTPSLIGPSAALYPSIFGSSSASLTLKVESNCLHGPIMASITELKHNRGRGKIITPDRISIQAPITNGYVSMAKPVLISKPQTGSHDIDLDFRLEVSNFESAGRYEGTITFTIMPLP